MMLAVDDAIPMYTLPGQVDQVSYYDLEPYPSNLARTLVQIENKKSIGSQIQVLEEIRPQLQCRGFAYRNEGEWIHGTTTLLRIGSLLLDILEKSFGIKLDILGQLIISIYQRFELRLFCHPATVKLAEPLFPLYISLLLRFWGYIKQQSLKQFDATIRYHFFLESLAILYLRLPQARCAILAAFLIYSADDLSQKNARLLAGFMKKHRGSRVRIRHGRAAMYNLLQYPPEWVLAVHSSGADHDQDIVPDSKATESLYDVAVHSPPYYMSFVAELFKQLDLCVIGSGPTLYDLLDSYTLIAKQAFLSFVKLDFLHNHPGFNNRTGLEINDFSSFAKPADLLTLCISAMLYATPVFDRLRINCNLDVIDALITAWAADDVILTDPEKAVCTPLPSQFCFKDLQFALDILLQGEDFQVLIKTLCFINAHLSRFNGRERYNLIQVLLIDRHFFKLFLHWHRLVREAFHVILVFKIRRGVAHPAPPVEDTPKGFLHTLFGYFKSFSGSAPKEDKQHIQAPMDEDPLACVMRLTQERDATKLLDICNFAVTRCACDQEDAATDTMLWMNALVHVKMALNVSGNDIHYASTAIDEFTKMQERAKELQAQHMPPLRPFEVIAPVLMYDIRTSMRDEV